MQFSAQKQNICEWNCGKPSPSILIAFLAAQKGEPFGFRISRIVSDGYNSLLLLRSDSRPARLSGCSNSCYAGWGNAPLHPSSSRCIPGFLLNPSRFLRVGYAPSCCGRHGTGL
jgi:hypothetical protein